MKMRNTAIIGVAIIVLAMLGAAGVGYALYMGNTYSEDNTMDVVVRSVDIYKDGEPIETPMPMPEFVRGGNATISGYTVGTTEAGEISLQCLMENGACWYLIESMTLIIEDGTNAGEYAFGIDRSGATPQVDMFSVPIEMDPDQIFRYGGESLLYYSFTIDIQFADVDVTEDPNYEELVTFEGANFTFVFEPSSS